MKKLLLFLVGLLSTSLIFAQQWSLISSSENKTYFTNAFGYLTGMRIDSVKSENGNSIYYPFKTIRTAAMPFEVNYTGASWLGDSIIENADSTYIPTFWQDTLVIKNNAQLGDTWKLYADSSDIYFNATVTAVDTQTIANDFDSVKTITIYPMQGNAILTDDSLYNMQFVISKSHGLIKALPFYFFPFYNYHQGLPNFSYDYYINSYKASINFKDGFTFNKVMYVPMKTEQIYNYEVGDVLVYKILTSYDYGFYSTEIDTIKSKQINNNTFSYDVQNVVQTKQGIPGQGIVYQTTFGSKTLSYSLDLINDTTSMPEEATEPDLEFYFPHDSSFCVPGPRYDFSAFQLGFEALPVYYSYKNSLGRIQNVENYFAIPFHSDTHLSAAIKNGVFCGSGDLLSINDVLNHATLNIFPNPAKDFITIECSELPAGKTFHIELMDVIGKRWGQWEMKHATQTIYTSNIPNGIYLLKISDAENSITKKINVIR